MKKYLLPDEGRFYKANLHCHTTVSDGAFTPAEIKEQFMARGYSIVAYTDHEVMVPHPELADEDFLPITSYEIAINEGKWTPFCKTYHLNIYSPEINRSVSRTFAKTSVWGDALSHVTDEMIAASTHPRKYTKEFVQWIIDTATEEGCLVSYNHPVWSLQSKEDYTGLRGFFGVEWINNGCARGGLCDTVRPIEDLLAEGERMCYPLGGDDCHGQNDCFGAWVCVKATSLDYTEVFEALRRGDFYSSAGPEIKELYIEDGVVHVKTSEVAAIRFITDHRYTQTVASSDGLPVTEATFSLDTFFANAKLAPEGHNVWFRIDVTDACGKYARTRAYFADEIGE